MNLSALGKMLLAHNTLVREKHFDFSEHYNRTTD